MKPTYLMMIADTQELYEARELELPMKDGKVSWREVDFKVFYKSHLDIQRTYRMQKKLLKFNYS